MKRTKQGQIGTFFVLLLAGGLIALYFGYFHYLERYFIQFHDGDTIRYLEIPSYAVRKSPARDEFFGQCVLGIALSPEQAAMNLASDCKKRGFSFRPLPNGFEIELGPKYIVTGWYRESKIELVWKPILTEKKQKKVAKMAAPALLVNPAEEKKKKK
jgi:hypothetical protein